MAAVFSYAIVLRLRRGTPVGGPMRSLQFIGIDARSALPILARFAGGRRFAPFSGPRRLAAKGDSHGHQKAGGGDVGFPTTVLVVEDEVLIRWVIADHLRDCGFRVIEAGSGDEAIDVLRKTALSIDVVFSDVQDAGCGQWFCSRPMGPTAATDHQGRVDLRLCESDRGGTGIVQRGSNAFQTI